MTSILNFLPAIIQLLFAVLLVWIILEDFKHRAVRWWLFPFTAIVTFGIDSDNIRLLDIIMNSVFVLIQVIMLTIYFSAKEKSFVNITQRYLGLGDILFWGVLCLLLSPLNFVLFFMASMLFTGIVVGIWKIIKSEEIGTIPLAGMQAIALLLVWTIVLLSGKSSFRNDEWIQQWIIV